MTPPSNDRQPPDPAGPDDDALVDRARAGDVTAFGLLVERHRSAALRVAAVICGTTADAEDIVQEAMVRAHARLATYRGDGSVRAWLLRIVANEAKNHVRGRVRRLRRDDRSARLELRATPGPDTEVVERAELRALATALAGLRRDDRAVLACRHVAELSEAETAVALGLPIGTVKSRTSRALDRLRDAMVAHELEVS